MQKTDMIAEITRCLEAAGLKVVASFGPFKGWTELVVYGGFSIDPKTGWQLGGERATIGYQENCWCFQSWERIPGPGPETLEHHVSTGEEIVSVTQHFFLGEAQTIEGWLVPIHRHPEWNIPRLRQVIGQAQSLSQEEWNQVSQRFREQYIQLVQEFGRSIRTDRSGPWSWRRWYACMTVSLEHEDSSSPTLWIRRDLEEAFLVKEVCPVCHHPTLVRTSAPVQRWPPPPSFPTYTCQTCGQRSRGLDIFIRADTRQEL